MPTAISLSFPWGRYHATPWGRHVNEAAVEWAAICAHGGGIRCGGMPMAGSPNGRAEADVTPR